MKKIFTNNLFLKVLSVVFAIMLWLVVVNIDDPTVSKTISGIPVVTKDENVITGQNQVYNIVSGDIATIVVSGPRSDVDKLTKDDFIAEASFSEMSNVFAVPIMVKHRYSKYEKNVDITQKTTTMKLAVENIISRSYEIQIEEIGDMTSSYTMGGMTVYPSTVEVKAPESVINVINKAVVEVNTSKYTDSTVVSLPVKFYTESGSEVDLGTNTELSKDTVDVTLDVYSVKEVPLKFSTIGTPGEGYMLTDVESDVQTVKIAGDSLSDIDSISIPSGVIDITGKTSDVSLSIDISGYLPENVILYNDDELIVNVVAKIEQVITKKISVKTKDIEIKNSIEGYKVSYPDGNSVSVQLKGLEASFEKFESDSLAPYIDLAGLGEGESMVAVNVTLPDNLRLGNSPTIKVKIVGEDESTTTEETTTEEATTRKESEKITETETNTTVEE